MERSDEAEQAGMTRAMSGGAAPRRVAVIGAGAVGCYYGGMLARAGAAVTLVGRPAHVQAMREHGLRLTTASFDEHVAVDASTEPSAAAGASLVLVCVKATDTAATAAALAPHVSAGAVVLSLQNGVDNAQRLQALLGVPVAPAVVYVASEMAGPGHVRHLGRGELVIPAEIESAADLVALFDRAGIAVDRSDNVVGALWAKLVLNCAYNALSAIADMPYGALVLQPGIAPTMRAAVLECMAVAEASDVRLPGDLRGDGLGEVFSAVDRIAATMPHQMSSTAQDLRRGKPSEIDHLNGFVADAGERLGVPVPINRALHALVRAIEARRRA